MSVGLPASLAQPRASHFRLVYTSYALVGFGGGQAASRDKNGSRIDAQAISKSYAGEVQSVGGVREILMQLARGGAEALDITQLD
jgi:hypothetical protein